MFSGLLSEQAATGAIEQVQAEPLIAAARGASLSSLLRDYADRIQPEVFTRLDGHLRWHVMRIA